MVEWGITHSLVSLLAVGGFLVAAWSLGAWLLRSPLQPPDLDEALICMAVGLGALILVAIAMTALHLLNRPLLIGALTAPAFFLWRRWRVMGQLMSGFVRRLPAAWRRFTWAERLLQALLALETSSVLILALTPVTGWDAAAYHLTIPFRYLEAGGWIDLPSIVFSYAGLNEEMLFLWGLALNGEQAAHLMAAAVGLLLVVGVYALARHSLCRQDARLAAAMFFLVPIVWDGAADLYVDLGMTFFLLAAILVMIKPRRAGVSSPLLVAGVLFGLALGIKLLAVLYMPILAACAWIRMRRMGGVNAVNLLMPAVVALLVWAVWPLHAYMLTGNPLYPIANPLFGLLPSPYIEMHAPMTRVSLPWRLLFAPWYLSAGNYSPSNHWDGGLGPFVLAFTPLAFLFRPHGWLRAWRWPMLFSFLVWIVFLPVLRFALPLMAMLSIYAAFGIQACRLRLPRFPAFARTSVILMGGLFCLIYAAKAIQRLPVVIGLESPGAYLSRYDSIYPVASWMNHYRTPGKGILLIGERSLRFSMPVYTLMAYSPYFREVFFDHDPDRFMTRLKRLGIAHVVVGHPHAVLASPQKLIRVFLQRYAVKVRDFHVDAGRYEIYDLPAMLSVQQGGAPGKVMGGAGV